jgi:hypothetical protein
MYALSYEHNYATKPMGLSTVYYGRLEEVTYRGRASKVMPFSNARSY